MRHTDQNIILRRATVTTQGFFFQNRCRVAGPSAPARRISSNNSLSKTKWAWLLGLLVGFVGLSGCGPSDRDPPVLRVSAAASLGPLLETLRPRIEAEFGVTLQLNLAGSGTLARQLLDGAPADVVILTHPDWMDVLIDAQRVRRGAVIKLAQNTLVVVGRGRAIRLDQLRDPRFARIAWGDPDSVPAGRYAEQALRTAGVWDDLRGRRVTTADVRAALRYAQSGEVDAAVVYASDASKLEGSGLRVLCEVDPATHDPIVITAGLANDAEPARRLLDRLQADEAGAAWADAGFEAAAEQRPR